MLFHKANVTYWQKKTPAASSSEAPQDVKENTEGQGVSWEMEGQDITKDPDEPGFVPCLTEAQRKRPWYGKDVVKRNCPCSVAVAGRSWTRLPN